MAKGTRTGILLVVLVLGSGWLVSQQATRPPQTPRPQASMAQTAPGNPHYPTPTPPYPGPQNWTLTVGPKACDVTETANGKKADVVVILRGVHWIKYKSDKGQPLGIVFHAPSTNKTADAPFKKMTFAGVDEDGSYMWQLFCVKNVCSTGVAVSGSEKGYWKTDQILDGTKCDAGVIIQP